MLDPSTKQTIQEEEDRGRDITKFGPPDARMPPRVNLNEWEERILRARGWNKGYNWSFDKVMAYMHIPEHEWDEVLYGFSAIEAGIQEETEKRRPRPGRR